VRESARIQSAIEIIGRLEKSPVPMDNTIRDYMANKRYIGSKDRKFIVELAYDIIRHYGRIHWTVEHLGETPSARIIMLTHLMMQDDPDLFKMEQHFSGEKHQPDKMSEHEKAYIQKLDGMTHPHPDMPEHIRVECPDEHKDRLQALWGDDFAAQMIAMLEPAALDLRANTIKVTREQAQASLAKDDVETIFTPYAPHGLRTLGKPYMSATKAFHKGMVEIQDEGSQLIAHICKVEPGMRVLDFCAGGGGKTLGIAAAMQGKGIIYATDNNSRRLEKGRRRYRKADVHNIEVRSLEEDKNRKWLRRQKGTMDVVLVDAPCTSSGTWRRNPDYRWNNYGPSMDEILTMQSEILERVADKVKVGGRLVYATCSLFKEENEDQIDKFLTAHDDYELQDISQIWPEGECPVNGAYLRLTPKDHHTDGFFTASLIRK